MEEEARNEVDMISANYCANQKCKNFDLILTCLTLHHNQSDGKSNHEGKKKEKRTAEKTHTQTISVLCFHTLRQVSGAPLVS